MIFRLIAARRRQHSLTHTHIAAAVAAAARLVCLRRSTGNGRSSACAQNHFAIKMESFTAAQMIFLLWSTLSLSPLHFHHYYLRLAGNCYCVCRRCLSDSPVRAAISRCEAFTLGPLGDSFTANALSAHLLNFIIRKEEVGLSLERYKSRRASAADRDAHLCRGFVLGRKRNSIRVDPSGSAVVVLPPHVIPPRKCDINGDFVFVSPRFKLVINSRFAHSLSLSPALVTCVRHFGHCSSPTVARMSIERAESVNSIERKMGEKPRKTISS